MWDLFLGGGEYLVFMDKGGVIGSLPKKDQNICHAVAVHFGLCSVSC